MFFVYMQKLFVKTYEFFQSYTDVLPRFYESVYMKSVKRYFNYSWFSD